MDLGEKRKREFSYYEDLYSNQGYAEIANKSPRHVVTDKIVSNYGQGYKYWLDVGCGGYKLKVPDSCESLIRVDPVHPSANFKVAIHELSDFFDYKFDVVSCFDVLEHLLPEDLDTGILQLWALTASDGRLIVSVGTGHGGHWHGRDAHLTQQPMEWWQGVLTSLCGVTAKHVATAKTTSPFFIVDKK